ncbi:uncharacterized protein LOC142344113 [Convolutriloba macropyga]|uniref:uncharacterized protein LOC142344113 n=1 Tax=Convolutriloba macropyga TaxID=536237 RepID=UPI003F5266B6
MMELSGGDASATNVAALDSGIEFDKNHTSSSSPTMSDENSGLKNCDTSLNYHENGVANVSNSMSKTPLAASQMSHVTKTKQPHRETSAISSAKKNLMPHSLLSIPPKSTAIESQPLVELENADSGDEEFSLPLPVIHHNSMGRKEYRRVQTKEPWSPKDSAAQHLVTNSSNISSSKYDTAGFSLTDSGDELDLIPPTEPPSRCSCISLCPSLFSYSSSAGYSYYKTSPGP